MEEGCVRVRWSAVGGRKGCERMMEWGRLEVGVGLECAESEEGRGCCTTKI